VGRFGWFGEQCLEDIKRGTHAYFCGLDDASEDRDILRSVGAARSEAYLAEDATGSVRRGQGTNSKSNTDLTRAYNTRSQLTHQWGPATCSRRHLYDSFGVMSGLHAWRAGDPGTVNGETIPSAFSSLFQEVATKRNPSRGPGSATLSRAADRAR